MPTARYTMNEVITRYSLASTIAETANDIRWRIANTIMTGECNQTPSVTAERADHLREQVKEWIASDQTSHNGVFRFFSTFLRGDCYAVLYSFTRIYYDKLKYLPDASILCVESVYQRVQGAWTDVTDKFKADIDRANARHTRMELPDIIKTAYCDATNESGQSPLRAEVEVTWKDSMEKERVYIALRPYEEIQDIVDDDEIFFYCNGIGELASLAFIHHRDYVNGNFPSQIGEDFCVSDIFGFDTYENEGR